MEDTSFQKLTGDSNWEASSEVREAEMEKDSKEDWACKGSS